MNAATWQSAVGALLASAGLRGAHRVHPLAGGSNNQVFRVDVDGLHALLKVYFHHADDPRDRLGAEFGFLAFAWERGLRCLPRPLALDPPRRLGLYEFVPGRALRAEDVTEGAVTQALEFFEQLNRHKDAAGARALPNASEACFSIADHFRCVERRLGRLTAIEDSSELHRQAAEFIRGELSEAWRSVRAFAAWRAGESGLSIDEELAGDDRCVSPSDFGFHNALWTEAGRLTFIDFEYAGWDDPAKMVCDFFCQPAVPVPQEHLELMTRTVASSLANPMAFLQRVALLLPVCRLKWCCILLNEFVPVGTERRRFAGRSLDEEPRKAGQLQKACQALQHSVSEWTLSR